MKLFFFIAAIFTIFNIRAFALENNVENKHVLSLAGGIASPSTVSALGENPAGLMNHHAFKFQGAVATGSDKLNPLGYGGFLFGGNGKLGGGIGIQGFNGQAEDTGNIVLLNWGVAAFLDTFNVAFGFTGTRTLEKTGTVNGTGSGTTWCVDVGMLYNPKGTHQFGLTTFQILDNVDAVGVGYAYTGESYGSMGIDFAYTLDSKTTVAKPGFILKYHKAQLAVGYGVRVIGDGWGWIRPGMAIGLAYNFSGNFSMQTYYNQLAKYYIGATFRI